MKKLLFLFVLLGGLGAGVSVEAANTPAVTCTSLPEAACITGTTCPNGTTKKADATCSPNGICCQKNGTGGGSGGDGSGKGAVNSGSGAGSMITITSENPLSYNNVEGVLGNIMGTLKGIVAVLAILAIVIAGIMYILSLGNPDRMKKAKNVIFAALIGLAIVIAAPTFLKEVSNLLDWNDAPAIPGDPGLTLTQIARNVLNFLLSIIGILALIMMIISGIMYLSSAGNDGRMKQAKSIFVASLIGITVALASMVLVTAVARFFE